MTKATDLIGQDPIRAMIVGYSGAGKTGALACLANAGFKLRILDFDHNLKPLLKNCTPEGLERIDVIQLEDKLRGAQKFIEVSGVPTAFNDACAAMRRWKYKDLKGNEVDLGPSKDWGPDTILVVDSGTGLGRASLRRAVAMGNRTPLNTRRQEWGLGAGDEERFLEILTSKENRFHVLVLYHLKLIGPRDEEKDDSDLTKEIKAREADLVPTRLFPSALGKALPQHVAEHFDTMVLVQSEVRNNRVKRLIRTVPMPALDIKVPAKGLDETLPLESGMLTIFKALVDVPGCLAWAEHADTSDSNEGDQ